MKKQIFNLFMLFSLFLVSNNLFAQGPGSFYFNNNSGCTLIVTIYAYDGACVGPDCIGGIQGDNGGYTVTANAQNVDIAAGYSGGGDMWGDISVTQTGSTDVSVDGQCMGSSGSNGDCGGNSVTYTDCSNGYFP